MREIDDVMFLLIWALCRHFFVSQTVLLNFLKREFETDNYDNSLVTLKGAGVVQKQSLADVIQNRCRLETLLKRDSNTAVYLWNLQKFQERLLLEKTYTLLAASGSKQCNLMKTYTEFMLLRLKLYTWTVHPRLVFVNKEYSSGVFQTLPALPRFSKVAGKSKAQSSKGVL